jgi:predicted negative regulator of RcsB-dependent stress response
MAEKKDKQIPEDDMAAQLLLKEVEDDMQQERMRALWNEWGSTIIGAALMVIFGTMIGVGWQGWRTSVSESQTEILIQSKMDMESDNIDELSGDYKGISALLTAASVAANDGTDLIVNGLMNDAIEADMPRLWDSLAKFNALRSKATGQDADINMIADDMVALANSRNNPFAPVILMEAGVLKAQDNQYGEAVALLEQANAAINEETSFALKQSIEGFITLYQSQIQETQE